MPPHMSLEDSERLRCHLGILNRLEVAPRCFEDFRMFNKKRMNLIEKVAFATCVKLLKIVKRDLHCRRSSKRAIIKEI